MRWRHPIVSFRAPPYLVLVHYYGRGNGIDRVTYIVCLNGRVHERCDIWSLNSQGVREVHPFARIRLLDDFRADTFQSTFFNSRRCRITFISWRLLNGSVEFIRFTDVTLDTEIVISTPKCFVHEWGTNPTMLWPTVSNFNRRVYVPITSQKGFCQRCNHKRLRLKWVEEKQVALEDHLSGVRQDMRDYVAANYASSPVNHALGDASPANSPRYPSSNDSHSDDGWIGIGGSNWCVMNVSIFDWLFNRLNHFIRITYFVIIWI